MVRKFKKPPLEMKQAEKSNDNLAEQVDNITVNHESSLETF